MQGSSGLSRCGSRQAVRALCHELTKTPLKTQKNGQDKMFDPRFRDKTGTFQLEVRRKKRLKLPA